MALNNQARLSHVPFLCLMFIWKATVAVPDNDDDHYHDDYDNAAQKWTYSGADNGVEKWASLISTCGGSSQSPIDLTSSAVKVDTGLQKFSFSNFDSIAGVTWEISNNGHSVTVSYTSGTLQVSGGSLEDTYRVAQFHFHWGGDDSQGSEHTIDNKKYPLEVHIVCWNTRYINVSQALLKSDGLAVLGFLYEISTENNPTMQKVVDALSGVKAAGDIKSMNPFKLDDLIASPGNYYRYKGSLTTPNCNEVVTWTVFDAKITISSTQMAAFRELTDSSSAALVNNYRPVQPRNDRTISANWADDKFKSSSATVIVSYAALSSCLLISLFTRN